MRDGAEIIQASNIGKQDEREQCAYHEAGHAVVTHVLGVTVYEIGLLDDETDDRLGYCRGSLSLPDFENYAEHSPKEVAMGVRAMKREFQIAYAGLSTEFQLMHELNFLPDVVAAENDITRMVDAVGWI